MAKSFKTIFSLVGWATPEFTPVDKKEPTPLVEAGRKHLTLLTEGADSLG